MGNVRSLPGLDAAAGVGGIEMEARELNERLAMALGWKAKSCVSIFCTDFNHNPLPYKSWVDSDGVDRGHNFIPATSVDALRVYVLPEVVKRKLWLKWFTAAIASPTESIRKCAENIAITSAPELRCTSDMAETLSCLMATAALFLCPPDVLAAAALEVLEGKVGE